ncbi:hypothetical protein GXP70_19835 [Paenibacillus lycopersici]|uniref:JAB domain-containing protein n=1 Tax=Paenibacillus lycopersici TaxID=2704462 RepID=A0A6C0G3V7_9BACL|nr:Mov34/MPN/PAD-1 family protein [Paenibacillus lycopersici]QHT62009.1 hypothetical protein GXP70_19835 [Paenibacillus lycopersici]
MRQPPRRAELEPQACNRLIETCVNALPYEACGVLSGSCHGELLRISGVHPIRNASPIPAKAFAFDPADWIRVLYGMQKNRQSLVGFFHSHPASPPVPSPADRDGLPPVDGGTSYWIVAPRHSELGAALQPYWLQDGTFHPLMLAQISV